MIATNLTGRSLSGLRLFFLPECNGKEQVDGEILVTLLTCAVFVVKELIDED